MKYLYTLLIISVPLYGFSQSNSGVIVYEEVTNMKIDMAQFEEQGLAAYVDKMPTSNRIKKQLIFTEQSSIYTNIKKDEEKEEDNEEGIVIKFSNSDKQTYRDTENNEFIEQEDFMGKTFLINGEPRKLKWKMTGEIKEIAGYPCLNAIYKDSTETLEAWFTTKISKPLGPENYGGLPGIILEINSKKERKVITAKSVTFRTIEPTEIIKPVKGKKVTREEYNKIVEKKMEELRQQNGGKDGIIMIKH